jgi:hypothetical protein
MRPPNGQGAPEKRMVGKDMVKKLVPAIRIVAVLAAASLALAACGTKATTTTTAAAATTTSIAASTTQPASSLTPTSAPAQMSNLFGEKTFDSPEAAINAFVSSIANNDFSTAAQTFAINEPAEKFDFAAYANYLKVIMPFTMLAPSDYALYVEMNKMSSLGDLTRQTKAFIYSFFETEGMDGSPIAPISQDDASQFVKTVDPSALKSLKIAKIETPSPDVYNSSTNLANFKRMASFYGADDMAERVVLYNLNGQNFEGGFRLLKYGSDWKIFGLNSTLAGQPGTGIVTKVAE